MMNRRTVLSGVAASVTAAVLPPIALSGSLPTPSDLAQQSAAYQALIDKIMAQIADDQFRAMDRLRVPYRFGQPLACWIPADHPAALAQPTEEENDDDEPPILWPDAWSRRDQCSRADLPNLRRGRADETRGPDAAGLPA